MPLPQQMPILLATVRPQARPGQASLSELRIARFAPREVWRHARAVSKTYRIGCSAQFLELAKALLQVGLSGDQFYLHQYYLPERRPLWRRHVSAYGSQWQLIERHGEWDDFNSLKDKIEFSRRAVSLGIPTIPVLASFSNGGVVDAPGNPPAGDLFSKPSNAWKGNHTKFWRYEMGVYRPSPRFNTTMKWDELIKYLRMKSGESAWILQEAARNHRELRALTNGALATIRIVTCRAPSGSIDIMPPVLRMPWGTAVADNMAQGGLVAPVDQASGRIVGPAYRKDVKLGAASIAEHPDTGVCFAGVQIPFWSEAVDLSIAAHAVFGSMFFIGWDVAILDDGPVILEGNPLWDVDVILLAHRIQVAQTQYVPYWLHHYEVAI